MKKSKFPIAFIAMLIAAVTVFAFTVKKAPVKKTGTVYHYTSSSTSLQDMQDTSNWEINATPGDCGISGDIPCTKEVEGGWDGFITYLNGFNDPAVLAADADQQKSSGQSK